MTGVCTIEFSCVCSLAPAGYRPCKIRNTPEYVSFALFMWNMYVTFYLLVVRNGIDDINIRIRGGERNDYA